MKRNTSYALTSLLSLLGAGSLALFLFGGCVAAPPTEDEHLGSADSALTAAQCNYFQVDGKVQICHRTGSAKNPYNILKISEQACVNAHALHAGDYVAVNDPTCQGGGCLPENAPCDATLPCCDGFSCTGGTCHANVSDHCVPSPCQNGSTCVNDPSGYTCQCPAGYTGTNCETEIDECAVNPCVNGQCLDAINAYVCECDPGWTGANCEIDIDECAANPCAHGLCTDHVNAYTCACAPGWTGTNCEIDIDECAVNPCAQGVCTDHVNAYTCACAPGWTGTNCEINIDECEANPCAQGLCIDHVNAYTCACAPGWTGTNCEIPVAPACGPSQFVSVCDASSACPCGWTGLDCVNNLDECEVNPCSHGTCIDRVGGYKCNCQPGWGGDHCDCPLPI